MANLHSPTALKLGIIDSGISDSFLPQVTEYQDFTGNDSPDIIGHGTAVASVICTNNSHIQLFIARVFDRQPICSARRIAEAIDWLAERDVALINLSFGLRQDRPVLADACRNALNKQILLVAASPARGEPVYPAQYPGVIRASGDARCAAGEISVLETAQADYGGCPSYLEYSAAGASIGCASVTGTIANILTTSSPTDIHRLLAERSSYRGPENRGLKRTNLEKQAI